MKCLPALFGLLLAPVFTRAQSVGIGTANPVSSAQLEIKSTGKGLLPPRMTKAQRDLIVNPIAGLIIWCNNCVAPAGELQVYNGEKWTNLTGTISPTGTATICTQVWATKNLDVERYRNGDPIPKVTDPNIWKNLTTGAYCYYNNDSATYASVYGKLYNWYAINDPRGLAPVGWHIPSNEEWLNSLVLGCLGGDGSAGGAMKEAGIQHWNHPNAFATNSSGFTALPGGIRNQNGAFVGLGNAGYWWFATDFENGTAGYIALNANGGNIDWDGLEYIVGLSVRCLRD